MKQCVLLMSLLEIPQFQCVKASYSMFLVSCSLFAPISRHEAELIQQQAPPSYGQLIAQGIIPPVDDFPTENPNEVREDKSS